MKMYPTQEDSGTVQFFKTLGIGVLVLGLGFIGAFLGGKSGSRSNQAANDGTMEESTTSRNTTTLKRAA